MYDCLVTSAPGNSDLTVVVVGHGSARTPRPVEEIAAAMAKGDLPSPQAVATAEGRWLVVKPETKPWLVGGEAWRLLGKDVVDTLRRNKGTSATVLVGGAMAEVPALVEGVLLADYRYNALRSGKEAKRSRITVRFPGQAEAVAAGEKLAVAQNLARELADTPPNLLNPATFATRAKAEAKKAGLICTVISGVRALTKAGFPGLVQVGKAGSAEPCLVELKYVPKGRPVAAKGKTGAKAKAAPSLALVGKGITFDTGGISIKPSDKMWEMKGDCGGACAVLGAMVHIAQAKPDVAVTGYLVLAENMPDQHAQRPGDIYRARNGKTIHVDNTDAEGRLVLADVLTYAAEEGHTHVVDVATLTGAVLVALGTNVAAVLSRHDAFATTVRQAGLAVGEECWQLPLYGEYRSLLDHPHADINNVGGRSGGTITAAIFLSEFIPETVQWAHLDIAGPAIQSGGWRYYSKGMTGFATRTLARLPHLLGK